MGRVLVVDDSIIGRRGIGSWLAEDHKVVEAENGAMALRLAKEGSFDMVITDVNMPAMSGIELVRYLRATPEYGDVPILVITTESSVEEIDRGKAAGVTAWIVKPVNPDVFRRAVARLMA